MTPQDLLRMTYRQPISPDGAEDAPERTPPEQPAVKEDHQPMQQLDDSGSDSPPQMLEYTTSDAETTEAVQHLSRPIALLQSWREAICETTKLP
jgi:hypothetical protein